MLMKANMLARRDARDLASSLTSNQLQLDGIVQHFSREAANPLALAAMTAGGLGYRLTQMALGGALAPLAARSGLLTQIASRAAIKLFSLGAEVSIFRSIGQSETGVFSGPEWLSDLLNFGLMKSVGHAAGGLNPLLNHGLQASAMTLGHQAAYQLGLGLRPEGSLVQQLVHAETTVLQMNAGLGLLHGITGGRIAAWERAMDAQLQTHPLRPELRFERSRLASFGAQDGKEGSAGLAASAPPLEAAMRTAWAEAMRGRKILDRNRGIIHDIRTPLQAGFLFPEVMLRGLETLPPGPDVEAMKEALRSVQVALRQVNQLIAECDRHQKMILEAPLSAEAMSDTAGRDTDATLLALSDVIQVLPRLYSTYMHAMSVLGESGTAVREKINTPLGKLGNNINKFHRLVEDQEKLLRGVQIPSVVSLNDVLEEAWLLSDAEREASRVETGAPQLADEEVLLHINRSNLMAAIINLLVNASHAMRESPQRQLALKGYRARHEGTDYAVIEVGDSGTGIAEEHRPHIFDPSFTTKPRLGTDADTGKQPVGSGMGLFMVSEMIRQYGGKIELETSLGQGTLFRIYLKAFDPRLGLEVHLGDAEREAPALEGQAPLMGRRYTYASLEKADQEFQNLARILHSQPEALLSSADKGRFLAQLAQHILAKHAYPDCQRDLIRLHRMIELAYVRLDFELVRSYREAIDPEVARYIAVVIEHANKVAEPAEHLAPLDAMVFELPNAYVIPTIDSLRANIATQFGHQNARSVYETAQLFEDERAPLLAAAFVNTFKNRVNTLAIARYFLSKAGNGISLDELLQQSHEDSDLAKTQEKLQRLFLEAKEYTRVLTTATRPHQQRVLQHMIYPDYNLAQDYLAYHAAILSLSPETRERFGIVVPPSLEALVLQLPESMRQAPQAEAAQ